MARKRRRTTRLGNLQLEIMRVRWSRGASTVAEVQEALGGRDLASTTVTTMLRKLEPRCLVSHCCQRRTFAYEATVPENEVCQGMAGDLLDRVFSVSLSSLVSHLLSSRTVPRQELDAPAALIAARRAAPVRRRHPDAVHRFAGPPRDPSGRRAVCRPASPAARVARHGRRPVFLWSRPPRQPCDDARGIWRQPSKTGRWERVLPCLAVVVPDPVVIDDEGSNVPHEHRADFRHVREILAVPIEGRGESGRPVINNVFSHPALRDVWRRDPGR